MEDEQIRLAKKLMRELPSELDKIEEELNEDDALALFLAEFFNCNQKVLAHRILGWKEYIDEKRL